MAEYWHVRIDITPPVSVNLRDPWVCVNERGRNPDVAPWTLAPARLQRVRGRVIFMTDTSATMSAHPHLAWPGPSLQEAVATVYEAFAGAPVPQAPLDACTYCCMDPACETQMRRLPLSALTAQHFYAYNGAAKSTVQPAPEMHYLLPRLLELVVQEAELHHALEITLQRLGACPAEAFSPRQHAAIA